MKLSENLKLEIKLHWFWLRATLPGAIALALFFRFIPPFTDWPLSMMAFMGLVYAVAHYCWWRQCLSPDKKTFTPRIWK